MLDMPRPRKPYTHREVTRHGKVVWYFRRDKKEPRIRLPGAYGSPEFNRAYDAALAGKAATRKPEKPAARASLRWLVNKYYESGRFEQFRPNTQRNQRLMLESVCRTGGDLKIAEIEPADVRDGLVDREATPRMAATFVSVMRSLFDYAMDIGLIEENPVGTIKARQTKTDGYHTWTADEVARYNARHPVGTQARLAIDIFLYTGLRRADACTLGRQHVRGSTITIRAAKNGAEITIPVLPPLATSIAATKTGDLVFLLNTLGRPWKSNSFGYWFAERCDEAGVPGRAHGLRKAGATLAADNGATAFELMAMYGWSSIKVAEIYTRNANRIKLAERGANKLFPHPTEVREFPAVEPMQRKASENGD